MSSPFKKVIEMIFGYFAGKIFGWFYIFYILAIIGGLLAGDEGSSIGFLAGLFLFLSFAILPFVVFAFFSIIIKKIKAGPDDLSIEFKIILAPLIFFICFIFFAFFNYWGKWERENYLDKVFILSLLFRDILFH